MARSAVVEVTVGDDRLLAALNRRWRRRPGPTDVLAVELGAAAEPRGRRWLWGEVYVSRERARVQARARRVTLGEELAALVAHGLLHLAGWDHRTAAARRAMDAAADALAGSSRGAGYAGKK